jgi:hypothetical protein
MAKKRVTGQMTKADAVRAALADGISKPSEGVGYIKSKFGLDVSAQMYSLYKSKEKKGGGRGNSRTPREGSSWGTLAPGKSGARNPAELARAVKQLVEQYGADAVREMAEVFAE